LVYIAVLALVLTLAVQFALGVFEATAKSAAKEEVQVNAAAIIQAFDFEIRNEPSDDCPDEQGISNVYPNPFFLKQHGEMHFRFGEARSKDFEVQIFTAGGRVIKTATLIDDSGALTPLSFTWDGRDNNNEMVASGIYIFQLKQDGFHQFKKFAVIHE
ncbi:T9SS type A sorting domain-containing protein, partial [candidate division KSB1 bacterium]|nr:T9SS type A sorting domain-containing protein [candidate division KSB1 bacterium]